MLLRSNRDFAVFQAFQASQPRGIFEAVHAQSVEGIETTVPFVLLSMLILAFPFPRTRPKEKKNQKKPSRCRLSRSPPSACRLFAGLRSNNRNFRFGPSVSGAVQDAKLY